MRTRRRATIQDLRQAIDCLPRDTRIAMLEGLRSNEIIVGAYSNGGGICPMLAAHRAGGRTNLIGFARAWDRFAFAGSRIQFARQATHRELLILSSHLEASLLEDEGPAPDLAAAMREHRALVARNEAGMGEERRVRSDERPGDPDRSRELRTKPGWSWMRPFRRYDEYERALSRLESEQEAMRAGQERELARQ
jgi:hypothetical protein